ncbi:tRNA (mo5U34)-methyltransferase [Clostridium tepidiprofundi DSM 19306]|uniref:tRNA (Mo5U34)-methyltransferase n=1 Tax=Clostridium tepidiprofundi DSM 19306 TaxID=1121338 RepID=A0A151B4Y6_9CLOT|nr:methyltransferase domain-containing protein [Clostridium tepidiprofundi]KYH34822.1 tRNA (mo5U34)-methyltransferase [Clostridium tepidiprofundi DSM 19306]
MVNINKKECYDEKNKDRWSKEIKKHQMLYPNERVVAFIARNYSNFNENKDKKALDIGFGSGRHLKLLMDYKFETYGIDYSQECFEFASSILGDNDRLKSLEIADLRSNHYSPLFFDLIICWGSIFYRTKDEMLKDLKIINFILKNEGKMIINFRTKEDYLYGKGKKFDNNTYILDASSGDYNDICYTFLSYNEAKELLSKAGFVVESSERYDLWKNNLSEKHTWWIFLVRKGE